MPYLELKGLKLHWQQTGEGPDVVLVHAFTSNLAIWMLTGVVEQLSARYRVTSYDLRGHGASSVPPTPAMPVFFMKERREPRAAARCSSDASSLKVRMAS